MSDSPIDPEKSNNKAFKELDITLANYHAEFMCLISIEMFKEIILATQDL